MEGTHRLHFWGHFISNPARVIVSSFALLILVGTLLLMLPAASQDGSSVGFLDALFTVTSATCVTGLVVHDTATQFTLFGQLLILTLIQVGGLGLVTFATFFNVLIRKKIGLKNLYVAQESISSGTMYDMGHLVKMILKITFATEAAGALLLMLAFVPKYGMRGAYISVFLAVSSYCNAGFDILGTEGPFSSLVHYYDNPLVLGTIMALIICGGLGFIVWQDLYHFRERRRLALHTKIVLISSGVLIILGAVLIAAIEWDNPHTLGWMQPGEKILNSLFMSVSTRTAGFNSIELEPLTGFTKSVMVVLMFIGAAPGSTGGGIKVTTAYVLLMTVICTLSGKEDTIIQKRRVDKSVVYKAMAVTSIALLAVIVSSATIFFTSHSGGVTFSEIDALFESASAFGTVGLSNGVTFVANSVSRVVLILTMFLGRVGPISLALSLAMRPQRKNTIMPEAKIMVG